MNVIQMSEALQSNSKTLKEFKFKEDVIRPVAKASLPSRFGDFIMYGFLDERNGKEHTAVVRGDIFSAKALPIRVHSECHTGDIFGSLRCDCRDQLEASLKYISKLEQGMVIYLRQEGRGIGLLNKLKAYSLQDEGYDTVEANIALGLPAEAREYQAAASIISWFEIESVQLLTNNPDKVTKLTSLGIRIDKRLPLIIESNEHNEFYLETKKQKMGHLF
jgi:GTP cyclohydrolase II